MVKLTKEMINEALGELEKEEIPDRVVITVTPPWMKWIAKRLNAPLDSKEIDTGFTRYVSCERIEV